MRHCHRLSFSISLTVVMFISLITTVMVLPSRSQPVLEWRYDQFMQHVQRGQVKRVALRADRRCAFVTTRRGQTFFVNLPANPTLIATLVKHNVDIAVLPKKETKLESGGCQ